MSTRAASPTRPKQWDSPTPISRTSTGCESKSASSFQAPKKSGHNGRLALSWKVGKRERLLYGDSFKWKREATMLRDGMQRLGDEVMTTLLNAGRHTIDLRYGSEYSHFDRAEVHTLDADLCPVQMRQLVMTEKVWGPPMLVREEEKETLGRHALRSLKAWWKEMTSDVVYDGPTG